jgi:hypothetical protein
METLQTATLRYDDPNYGVEIVVKQATVIEAMALNVLQWSPQVKAIEAILPEELRLPGMIWWAELSYSACFVLTSSITNDEDKPRKLTRKISPEEYLNLPGALQELWWEAVLKLNPQLMPNVPATPNPGETVVQAKNGSEPSGASNS